MDKSNYIVSKVNDVIEYVRRSTLNMTNLNTAHNKEKVNLDYITSYHILSIMFRGFVSRPL